LSQLRTRWCAFGRSCRARSRPLRCLFTSRLPVHRKITHSYRAAQNFLIRNRMIAGSVQAARPKRCARIQVLTIRRTTPSNSAKLAGCITARRSTSHLPGWPMCSSAHRPRQPKPSTSRRTAASMDARSSFGSKRSGFSHPPLSRYSRRTDPVRDGPATCCPTVDPALLSSSHRPTTHSIASYSAEGSIRVMPTSFPVRGTTPGGQDAPVATVSRSGCTARDRFSRPCPR